MLDLKAKNIKRRTGQGCSFIKKEEYVRQKYATLQKSCLIFNNQLQKLHLPPKYFNEK